MNFLAHFHLARPTDASRSGALLGDFVRGPRESLLESYPEDLVDGIMLHREIDAFTDRHPVFLKAKMLLAPERRRFAGIIIDVFFDHFLAQTWSHYSDESLAGFIDNIYQILDRRSSWMTPELREIIPRMKTENWLGTYGTIEGLALTFRRISTRRDFLKPLIGSEDDLTNHYHSLGKAFRQFYPEAREFARTLDRCP
ncbi:ACP phosphodiesterase [Verrucomicrobiaceae bacterium 227]